MRASAIRRSTLALLLGVCATSPVLADWRAERVGGEVVLGDGSTLADGQPVTAGSALTLGDDTALTLRHGGSRLRTRGPARLTIHADAHGGAARVVLDHGALRASAGPDDVLKVNVGLLRLKLEDAEVWTESADADRVCALQGVTAVQHVTARPTYSLREAGACRTAAREGVLLHEWPDRAALNARLARADGGSRPLPVSFQPPSGVATSPDTTPSGPTAASTPDPASPTAPAQAESTWYVVLGAFSTRTRAQTMLRDAALDGRVLAAGADGPYRSVVGPLADRAAAHARRTALRERFAGAWVLSHTP